jgi:serine/threonine-protein kinase HipA
VIAQAWNEVRLDELFATASGSPVDRVAIPGVQDKVSARMITLPVAQRSDRFILKLNPPEFPHLVENEKFFLDAARSSGLEVAQADIVHDSQGLAGLLVRRFDRKPTQTGMVRLLAQEDACQVLGRYPADKYRLTSEQVIAGLATVCRSRAVAARALFRHTVFAYLTCNGDAHGKNFSVLHDGEWRVTPIYDIPSSHPYGDHTLALSIAGRTREDVGRSDFLTMAAAVGLSARAAEKAIDALLERMDLWLPRLDALPFDPQRIHKLRRAIEYRRKRLASTRRH